MKSIFWRITGEKYILTLSIIQFILYTTIMTDSKKPDDNIEINVPNEDTPDPEASSDEDLLDNESAEVKLKKTGALRAYFNYGQFKYGF